MRYAFLLAVPISILGAQPMAAQAPTVVNVQLANFKFTPKSIVLDHGHAYVLRLQNVSDGGHDFTASDFFAAANVAAQDRRLVSEGEVEVPAGQVREIHLTAPAAGKYSLKCSHSFHKMFGMSGSIIVR
jgi:uncharacterized cupredoxin-like copper-binding protein